MSTNKLVDGFGRRIDYMRISLTDKCDLRCRYCIAQGFRDFGDSADYLSFDQIVRVVAVLVQMGLRSVRLTGGEPLLRKNVMQLVGELAQIEGIDDIALSTNATRLATQAHSLKTAGLTRLNVSLDSLRPARVQAITGQNCLHQVLEGLDAADQAGFTRIKINMVLLPQVNEDEVLDVARFCFARGYVLRLIENMPLGDAARQVGYVSAHNALQKLVAQFDLHPSQAQLGAGPARYWQSVDGVRTVGVITPLSEHFCAQCNRIRLTANGELLTCLGHEHGVSLRAALASHMNTEELKALIAQTLADKPYQHEFVEQPEKIIRIMARTGG